MRPRLLSVLVLTPLLGACATKRDLRDLRTEVEAMRSSQEALLREIVQQNELLRDSMTAQDVRLRGDLLNRLLQMERQLVQIQELTGQGQQRLAEMREELRRQEESIRISSTPGAPAGSPAGAPTGDPEEIYAAAEGALMRGSFTAARTGFETLVRNFPQHELAPQAQLGIGETYEKTSEPERALEAYSLVPQLYPDSPQAPTALLRAGRIEAERDNREEARDLFSQLIGAYPDSPEAETAREELAELRR
ncbi:MAG TPA: tetratricopeptide repeat protein [Longimicrobiaceae bacterium]